LSESGTTTIELADERPLVIAWLPYSVKEVKLTVGREAHPSETIRVGLKPVVEGQAAFLLWHYELLDPDGEICRWARNSASTSEPRIHFALDEPEGIYTLQVREVLTGAHARTEIPLTKDPQGVGQRR